MTVNETLTYTRLYADAEGESHFEDKGFKMVRQVQPGYRNQVHEVRVVEIELPEPGLLSAGAVMMGLGMVI